MVRHPIASGASEWDGKVYEVPPSLAAPCNIAQLGTWLTRKGLPRFDMHRNASRAINGRAVFFPLRPTTGIHCVWIEEVSDV